jgi:hypothetical protein
LIKHQTIDRIGFMASAMCAVHCLAMPVVMVLLPYAGMIYLEDENFEKGFIILSCFLGLTSICFGINKHKRVWPLLPLSLGIIFLMVGLDHHHHDNVGAIRNFFGGLCIAVSHLINWKLCNVCSNCTH